MRKANNPAKVRIIKTEAMNGVMRTYAIRYICGYFIATCRDSNQKYSYIMTDDTFVHLFAPGLMKIDLEKCRRISYDDLKFMYSVNILEILDSIAYAI
ncbi:hypothetical protein J6A31_05775 [bacterium]|nr:hypothetical protein [bacterium]